MERHKPKTITLSPGLAGYVIACMGLILGWGYFEVNRLHGRLDGMEQARRDDIKSLQDKLEADKDRIIDLRHQLDLLEPPPR